MFGSEQEYVERVRAELTEATRLRLVSDVPLGAFLSGGLDSTIIVGLMQRLLPRPAQTFSIRFSEWDYDEGPYARLAAERLEADHHEFVVQANCLEILPELIWHYGEPFADSSAVPTYYVSKLTRQAVTVALTGDGGDELFGGYNRYHVLQRMARFDAVPRGLRDLGRLHAWKRMLGTARPGSLRQRAETFLELVALSPRDRAARIANVGMGARLRAELYLPEFAAAAEGTDPLGFIREAFDSFAGRDSVTRTMLADQLTYLPGDILTKVDIASMANGLETRPPFLDHRVVELAARMPLSFKLRGRQGKYILKKAFADFVPREILDRKKMGFVVPVKQWFRHELREYTRQILLDPMTLGRGYFYAAVVERLVNEHLTGAKDHTRRLWLLLCFELWHRQFIDASRGGGTRAA
jgi:asparagine synthase (glutamine-hydrolysing)